jgi:hypothetical protein
MVIEVGSFKIAVEAFSQDPIGNDADVQAWIPSLAPAGRTGWAGSAVVEARPADLDTG